MKGSAGLVAGALVLGLALGAGPGTAFARAPEDRILPAAQHTSDKGRALASKHAAALRALNAEVYHCLPWVEVQKGSIGFFKPRHLPGDSRFLSIRIYIEQEPSAQFSALTTQQRASAMFSRYVGPMLKRMTRNPAIANDDGIDGYTVVLEWMKATPASRSERPIHETIAVFVDKVDADEYVAGRTGVRELAARARTLAFDGEKALGALTPAVYDDDFVTTYRIKGYQPDPTVVCHQ